MMSESRSLPPPVNDYDITIYYKVYSTVLQHMEDIIKYIMGTHTALVHSRALYYIRQSMGSAMKIHRQLVRLWKSVIQIDRCRKN